MNNAEPLAKRKLVQNNVHEGNVHPLLPLANYK